MAKRIKHNFYIKYLSTILFLSAYALSSYSQLKLVPLQQDLSRNTAIQNVSSRTPARTQAVSDTVNAGINISITNGYNPRCSSEPNLSLTFRANYFNAGANPVFQWLVNGILVGNGTIFTSNTLNDKDTVQCKIISDLNCTNKQRTIVSNKIAIVYADTLIPQIDIVALDGANTACSANYPITFVATAMNGGSNPQIKWFYNATFTGIVGNVFAKDSMADKRYVFAELTSNLVCATKTIVDTSEYISRNVARIILPIVSIKIDSVTNANCSEKVYNFSSTASNRGANPIYRWFLNNILVETTTSSNFTTNLNSVGDEVFVQMQTSIQCANPELVSSNSIQRLDTLNLPFFEDFTGSFDQPSTGRWIKRGGAYINNTYATQHPNHNTATFDGLKYNGAAYDTILGSTRGVADQLVSLPINLVNITSANQSTTWLSFFWQHKGIGDVPEGNQGDALALYFKNENQNWIKVWEQKGIVDSIFRRANIQILSDDVNNYFHSNFQFKFENTGRLSGSFDIWNIDYIYLNTSRNAADTFFLDQGFSKQPIILLNNGYTSMPISHFTLVKNNLGNVANLSSTFNNLDDVGNNNTFTIDASYNAISLNILTKASQFTPGNAYNIVFENTIPGIFWENIPDTKTEIDYAFSLNGDQPNSDGKKIDYTANNTLKSKTILDNFYAYDDGSAEFGIGLNQRFASLLFKFINYSKPDTLKQIAIHFTQLGSVLVDQSLNLLITTNLPTQTELNNTKLPPNVLYNENHPIVYAKTVNNWTIYNLKKPVIIDVDSFYVGYKQITDDLLAVGWDKNTNSAKRIYYNLSNKWFPYEDSEGSLMIRPVFGNYNYLLSAKNSIDKLDFILYPNPTNGILNSDFLIEEAYLYNLQGAILQTFYNTQVLDLQSTKAGIYLLKVKVNGRYVWRKISKQ
ncbi:MAG: T9SS type A sorting domain-containing protein [Cytophagales bacterium]